MNILASIFGLPHSPEISLCARCQIVRKGYHVYTTDLTTHGQPEGERSQGQGRTWQQAETGGQIMRRRKVALVGRQDSLANQQANRIRYGLFDCVAAQSIEGRFLEAQKSRASRAGNSTGPCSTPAIARMTNMDVLAAPIWRLIYWAFLAHTSRAAFRCLVSRASDRTYPLGTQSGAEGAEPID